MLKLTEAGKIICDAISKRVSTIKYYPALKYNGERVIITANGSDSEYSYIAPNGVNIYYAATFCFFGNAYGTCTYRVGKEFEPKTDVTATAGENSIPLYTMSHKVSLGIECDPETGINFLSGVINNTTAEDLTVKLIGLQDSAYYSPHMTMPSANASQDDKSISLGILSYIELEEPIIVPANGEYAIKISLN